MRIIPQNCSSCSWLYSKMGACPTPQASIIWSYLSFIPYLLIFYLILLTLYSRKASHIKLSLLLISGYLIGDKLLKNVFKSQRPEFSCKTTYGMPSSHMTVMVLCMVYYIMHEYILNNKNYNKLKVNKNNKDQHQKSINYQQIFITILLIISTILQGLARVILNYHTIQQVIGGIVFGILYYFVYEAIFNVIYMKIHKKLYFYLPFVKYDLFDDYQKQQQQTKLLK